MDYIELNLLEMLDTYGEDKLQAFLSRFMCPQNTDVENFIQTKAIGFAQQKIAMMEISIILQTLFLTFRTVL